MRGPAQPLEHEQATGGTEGSNAGGRQGGDRPWHPRQALVDASDRRRHKEVRALRRPRGRMGAQSPKKQPSVRQGGLKFRCGPAGAEESVPLCDGLIVN